MDDRLIDGQIDWLIAGLIDRSIFRSVITGLGSELIGLRPGITVKESESKDQRSVFIGSGILSCYHGCHLPLNFAYDRGSSHVVFVDISWPEKNNICIGCEDILPKIMHMLKGWER